MLTPYDLLTVGKSLVFKIWSIDRVFFAAEAALLNLVNLGELLTEDLTATEGDRIGDDEDDDPMPDELEIVESEFL